MDLVLETKEQENKSPTFGTQGGGVVMMTPPVGGDYWLYRVAVADNQAIIGFPKFNTVGIGFQIEEEDWNTNLPVATDAAIILNHIWANRGPGNDSEEFRTRCLDAIQMIQKAVELGRRGIAE